MRPDGPVQGLNEAQKRMADVAGIPVDRPGLLAEYPKMVYKAGYNPRHQLESKAIPIGNGPIVSPEKLAPGYEMETAFVDDAADEAAAIASGWFLSADPAMQKAEEEHRLADMAKDLEIAELKAQLAQRGEAEKRGPGRPPKSE